jgi:NifU-like protein involved in Fe-S cluster formation
MMYTDQVRDHIANPRNAGEIAHPSASGDAVNEVCLDRIRLTLQIVDGVVKDAKFKASGCPPTIAAGSALTELLVGRQLRELDGLGPAHVEASLGRLPVAKRHCAQLAIEALRSALTCLGVSEAGSDPAKD